MRFSTTVQAVSEHGVLSMTSRSMKLCWTAFVFWALSVPTVQGVTCSCEGGCDSAGMKSADGTKVNVAYGKAANISSRFSNPAGETAGPGCLAVNGKTGTIYKPVTDNGGSCLHSSKTDYNPWWQVDLGLNYRVFNVTIYNRQDYQRHLAKGKLYVDSQLCYTFPDNTNSPAKTKFDVSCSTPLIGQVVKFERRGQQGTPDSYYINICEVQVWVCADGHYGSDCQQQCGHCKNNGMCDRVTGVCPDGCDPRWTGPKCNTCFNGSYGMDCTSACGNCLHGDVCDKVNGTCPNGCQPGFVPSDPLCNEVCSNGSYGLGCMSTCGNCSHGDVCDKVNGTCPNGCQPGFESSNRLCNEAGCADGYHGGDCREQCGHCANNDVCDKQTGQCPHGCQPGYQPPDCKQSCTGNTYGENCAKTCGSCQMSAPCDVTDGTCDVCLDQSHFVLPFCKECSDGWYGPQCDLPCINCDVTGSCDQSSGQCDHGCSAGWVVSATNFCDQECRFSTYGKGCQYRCGNCLHAKACRHDNGTCEEGCAEGYEGERCYKIAKLSDKSDNASLAGPIAGAIFGGLVVVAVTIFFLGMWWFWSKRHNGGLNAANTGVTNPPSSPGGQGSASIGDLICSPIVTSHSNASHADAGNDEGGGHYYDIPDRARDDNSNKYEYTTAVFKKGNEDSVHVYVNAGQDPDSKTN